MTENYTYFSVAMSTDPKVAFIERLSGIGKDYLLDEGIRLAESTSTDLIFDIAEDSGVMLTDFINNITSNLLVSADIKGYFEQQGLNDDQVEYLPFKIRNQRGRVEHNKPYYIANILSVVDCLDLDRADYKIHPIEGTPWRIKRIEIDENKTHDKKLFRLGEEPRRIIIRSDLAEGIERMGFTGLRLWPVGKPLP